MFNLKEIISILLASLVFAFAVSFRKIFDTGLTLEFFLIAILIAIIIIFINTTGKKISAIFYEAEIEEKILQWQRYGIYERSYLKNPLPGGIIFPFIITILTQGYVIFLPLLQFEISPRTSKVSKSRGLYRYSEMTDREIGKIAATGIVALFIAIVIAYILPFESAQLFGKLAVFYVFWNMLPFGQLDGTKILFGSRTRWTILAFITLILLGYTFLLI